MTSKLALSVIVAGIAFTTEKGEARETIACNAGFFMFADEVQVALRTRGPARYAPPVWREALPRRRSGSVFQQSLLDRLMRANPDVARARSSAFLRRRLEQASPNTRDAHGDSWSVRSLSDAIQEYLGVDIGEVDVFEEPNKVIYHARGRDFYIVEDPGGGYFRVFSVRENAPIATFDGPDLNWQARSHFRSDEPVPASPLDERTIALYRDFASASDRPRWDLMNWPKRRAIQESFQFLMRRDQVERVLDLAEESGDTSWSPYLTAWLRAQHRIVASDRTAYLEALSAKVLATLNRIDARALPLSELPSDAFVLGTARDRAAALTDLIGKPLRARDQRNLILLANTAFTAVTVSVFVKIAEALPDARWLDLLQRWETELQTQRRAGGQGLLAEVSRVRLVVENSVQAGQDLNRFLGSGD